MCSTEDEADHAEGKPTLRLSRQKIWDEPEQINTWGIFQIYVISQDY